MLLETTCWVFLSFPQYCLLPGSVTKHTEDEQNPQTSLQGLAVPWFGNTGDNTAIK